MSTGALQVFVLHDGQLLSSEVFAEGTFTIGSESTCDLVLADELIAPMHALLQFKDGEVRLTDQGSPAGTLVNGQLVAEEAITSADDIHIGPYLLKLRQLSKKRPANVPPPSGYAGAPVTVLRPRTSTSVTRAARSSSAAMPTPRPGGLAAPLARSLAPAPGVTTPAPAPVIPIRPAKVLDPDVDVDAIVDNLGRKPTPPASKAKSSQPITVPLSPPEPTLQDVSYLHKAERSTTPAAPLWIEVPENELDATEVDVGIEDEPQSPPEASAPPSAVAASPVPGMVPAPPMQPTARPVPVIAPTAPSAAKVVTEPSGRRVLKSVGPEQLHVRVLWGKHLVAARTFESGEPVVAAPNESVSLPLYGFHLVRPTTLAEPATIGWNVRPQSDARVTARDNLGRWQPAAATVAHGVSLLLDRPVRLSVGDVHVEFVRKVIAPTPVPRQQDRSFLKLVGLVALVTTAFVVLLPNPVKRDAHRFEGYVHAMFKRHPALTQTAPTTKVLPHLHAVPAPPALAPRKEGIPQPPLRVEGQIDLARLAMAINEQVTALRDCYEQALLRHPDLGSGAVTIEWIVDTTGNVSTAAIKHSTLNHGGAEQCLLGVIRDATFPRARNGTATVSYTIPLDSKAY